MRCRNPNKESNKVIRHKPRVEENKQKDSGASMTCSHIANGGEEVATAGSLNTKPNRVVVGIFYLVSGLTACLMVTAMVRSVLFAFVAFVIFKSLGFVVV